MGRDLSHETTNDGQFTDEDKKKFGRFHLALLNLIDIGRKNIELC